MHRFWHFIRKNIRTLVTLGFILIVILLLLYLEVDKKAVTIVALVLGYVTQVFAGLTALIALIPVIGPLIVKLLTIPLFWLMNMAGSVGSAVAIKKGFTKDVVTHRLLTLVLLIGIILGYVLGHLIPVR